MACLYLFNDNFWNSIKRGMLLKFNDENPTFGTKNSHPCENLLSLQTWFKDFSSYSNSSYSNLTCFWIFFSRLMVMKCVWMYLHLGTTKLLTKSQCQSKYMITMIWVSKYKIYNCFLVNWITMNCSVLWNKSCFKFCKGDSEMILCCVNSSKF